MTNYIFMLGFPCFFFKSIVRISIPDTFYQVFHKEPKKSVFFILSHMTKLMTHEPVVIQKLLTGNIVEMDGMSEYNRCPI
jgi:hypothetical protein